MLAGGAAAATLGPYLVLVLLASGVIELAICSRMRGRLQVHGWVAALPLAAAAVGGIPALIWVAFKVGALSYGGGFVIIPLMQGDAVHTYHWMTSGQFLNAVALGQITPGPVVATVAAVGYAAHGVGGGVLAAVVAFLPSFLFVLIGGRHFDRLRGNWRAQRFLDGAGPAALGRDLRLGDPAGGRAERGVAVRAARGSGRGAPRRTPGDRHHARGVRSDRRDRRDRGRADPSLIHFSVRCPAGCDQRS